MRPIKFRCWNGEKFVNVAAYQRWRRGMLVGNYNVIFDQFTGIHDCNKKEIFESDLIKFLGNIHIVKFGECITPVGFGGMSMFYLQDINNKDQLVFQDWSQNAYEIIGSIHENPELLETK